MNREDDPKKPDNDKVPDEPNEWPKEPEKTKELEVIDPSETELK